MKGLGYFFISLFSLVITLVFLFPDSPLQANELDQYQRFIEYQKQQLQKRQERIDSITLPAQKRLEKIQENIDKTNDFLADNEARLQKIRNELTEITDRYQNLQGVFHRTKEKVVARLRFLQRQPPATWWIALFSSKSLREFLDRRQQLLYIFKQDKQLLTNLKAVADSVLVQRDEIKFLENEALLIQQQLNHQQAVYAAQAENQQRIIQSLQKDRRSLEIAEARLLQDSRRLATLIQSRTEGTLTLPPGNGALSYPIQGIVTSTFGWRVHPILGYEKFHTGIDFAADYGTPIYASQAGTVIVAEWYGGYGNTIVLDHGNGISTLYAHADALYVQAGETVQRGQLIAGVGSTGFSTGPHLHFELRAQGEPIDPAPYL